MLEPQPLFATIQLNKWSEAHTLSDRLWAYVFRGHQDSQWEITSSLERHYDDFCSLGDLAKPALLRDREDLILEEFRRRAHRYLASPPEFGNALEWLALIQHFGGPTRLVDFTHSFYAAAFFAVEQAHSDAAIWAVDIMKLNKILSGSDAGFESNRAANARNLNNVADVLSQPAQTRSIIPVEPFTLNERISIQQGLFLIPCDLSVSFMLNLAAVFGQDKDITEAANSLELSTSDIVQYRKGPPVLKIVLPRDIHRDAIIDLKNMNITAETLFPGLEGFSRSLIQHLRMGF